MALAKKCDACQKFYDFIETENEPNGITLCFIDSQGKPQNTISKKELCPECIGKIRDVLSNKN